MSTEQILNEEIKTLTVSSQAFTNRQYIPKKYTYDGENVNPPLTIEHIPEKTKSLVLIMDEPNAPIKKQTHWLVWNIIPTKNIKEKSIPGVEGFTDFGSRKYNGPYPATGGIHYYHFKIYALDELLDLNPNVTKYEVEKEMSAHLLAFGELIGLYKRSGFFGKSIRNRINETAVMRIIGNNVYAH